MYVICTYTRIQKHATRHCMSCVFSEVGVQGSGIRIFCVWTCVYVLGLRADKPNLAKIPSLKKAMNLLKPV